MVRVPPGFFPADLAISQDTANQVTVRLSDGLDGHDSAIVARAVATHVDMVRRLADVGTTFFAHGIHPEQDGGAALSTLTLVVREVEATNPRLIVATLAQAATGQECVVDVESRRFPAGTGVVAEYERGFAMDPDGSGEPFVMRQIQVAFSYPKGGHVAVLELSTAALEHWDDYRAVMLGLIAPTVTFARPEGAPAGYEQADQVTRMIRGEL